MRAGEYREEQSATSGGNRAAVERTQTSAGGTHTHTHFHFILFNQVKVSLRRVMCFLWVQNESRCYKNKSRQQTMTVTLDEITHIKASTETLINRSCRSDLNSAAVISSDSFTSVSTSPQEKDAEKMPRLSSLKEATSIKCYVQHSWGRSSWGGVTNMYKSHSIEMTDKKSSFYPTVTPLTGVRSIFRHCVSFSVYHQ